MCLSDLDVAKVVFYCDACHEELYRESFFCENLPAQVRSRRAVAVMRASMPRAMLLFSVGVALMASGFLFPPFWSCSLPRFWRRFIQPRYSYLDGMWWNCVVFWGREGRKAASDIPPTPQRLFQY